MKKLTVLLLITGMVFNGCSLEEETPFLDNESIYANAANARLGLDGIYQGVAAYDLYGNIYYFLNGLYSGMMVSKRGGNNVNTIYNTTLANLNVPSGSVDLNDVWKQTYRGIGRANDAISLAIPTEDPQTNDELVINDVLGQAYFVRAFLYFKLVSLWGEVPLRLVPTTPDNIHLATSSRKEVFEQVIADAEMAISLMNGTAGDHYPASYAVNMLLAKVYMSLATAPASVQDGVSNYWQEAYDQAIQVYGQYSLVADYSDLFAEDESNGSTESIFELQSSDGASTDWPRSYSPSNFINVNTFGRLQVNADFHDLHVATYPSDPRLASTFISSYTNSNGGNTTLYPDRSRNNFGNAHPYFFKLSEKNQSEDDLFTNQNIIIYRYGELLLMLAEISNELQNGEETGYVEELLSRVGVTPHPDYYTGQATFRNAIMREYQFELLGEGEDCINLRRRGYDWYKTNVIDYHNNNPLFDPLVDVMHTEGEELMFLPIPDAEINTNQEIQQ